MNFRKFARHYGLRLLAAVLAAVAVALAGTHLLKGRAGVVSNTAGVIKAPLQSAVSGVVDWFESLYGYIYEYDKLVAENESLRAQLAEAQEEVRLGAADREENAHLRELLNLREQHSDFVFESARVVNWNSSNWSSAFTLSKGENAGIAVGMPVVTEAGILVGQVSELGDNWANVRTVIDVETNVGVLVGEAGNAAMAIGDFALMQSGRCKIYHLTEGTSLLEKDVVLTSGRGGAFPRAWCGLYRVRVTEPAADALWRAAPGGVWTPVPGLCHQGLRRGGVNYDAGRHRSGQAAPGDPLSRHHDRGAAGKSCCSPGPLLRHPALIVPLLPVIAEAAAGALVGMISASSPHPRSHVCRDPVPSPFCSPSSAFSHRRRSAFSSPPARGGVCRLRGGAAADGPGPGPPVLVPSSGGARPAPGSAAADAEVAPFIFRSIFPAGPLRRKIV